MDLFTSVLDFNYSDFCLKEGKISSLSIRDLHFPSRNVFDLNNVVSPKQIVQERSKPIEPLDMGERQKS